MPKRGEEQLISGAHAARAAGISHRQLDFWTRAGLIVPQRGNASPGYGHPRQFTTADVDALRVLGALMPLRAHSENGLVRRRFAELARQVQAQGARGRFELIPGVTVDLKKLVAARVEIAA
jgi:MerR HTH family regulatory protein